MSGPSDFQLYNRFPDSAYWRLSNHRTDLPHPYKATAADLKSLLQHYVDKAPKRATLSRLRKLLRRAECGLLYYDSCSTLELKSFVVDRGLALTTKKRCTNSLLIEVLENADDDITFDRFFNLPPELRNQVYEYHFGDFGYYDTPRRFNKGVPVRHTQPPLTMAHKILRQETLSLFYSSCLFNIRSECGPDFLRSTTANSVPVNIFKALKNIQLSMQFGDKNIYSFSATIELPIHAGRCRVEVTELCRRIHFTMIEDEGGDGEMVALEDEIQSSLDEALAQSGGTWQLYDLENLVDDLTMHQHGRMRSFLNP